MTEPTDSPYRHAAFGMPLSGPLARELILDELRPGIALSRAEIAKRIVESHRQRGGRETSIDQAARVIKGIMRHLVPEGVVERPMTGWYRMAPNLVDLSIGNLSVREGHLPEAQISRPDTNEDTDDMSESPLNSAGVYVYSYPRYMPESGSKRDTGLYKIGASGNVADRVSQQRRQTEVPEDLVLVRVFYDEDPFGLERKFHSILTAANMHQKTTQGGAEWFSCNLATIDAIAEALKKKVDI